MTARTLLDGLIAGGFVAVMAAAVRLTLAAIGDLDHEARPVLASKAWLEAREKAAVSWWRAHRWPVVGLLWPRRGRHLAGGWHPLDEYPETSEDGRVAPQAVSPGAGDAGGKWEGATGSSYPGALAGSRPDPRTADDDRLTREHMDEWAAGRFTHEDEAGEPQSGFKNAGLDDDLTDEPGDDWPDTLHDLNAEHLVPTHEPQASGPGRPPPTPPGAAGEAPGPEPRPWPGIDDTPDAPAIEQPQYRLDDLNARIEAARRSGTTTADPQLLPAIRAALGFDSVACWEDAAWASVRKLGVGANA